MQKYGKSGARFDKPIYFYLFLWYTISIMSTKSPNTVNSVGQKPLLKMPNAWLLTIFIVASFVIVFFTSSILMVNLPEVDPITNFQEGVARWTDRTFEVEAGGATGTAFVVETEQADGKHLAYLITNHHVISADATAVTVEIDEEKVPATVVGWNQKKDLAVLSCEIGKRYKRKTTARAVLGEQIMALGYGEGSLCAQEGVVSRVVAVDPSHRGVFHEVTSPLEEGMSGGPVFNETGKLLGISAYRTEENGVIVPTENYIIPSAIVMQEYENLKKGNVSPSVSYAVSANRGTVTFAFGNGNTIACNPTPRFLGEKIAKVGKTDVKNAIDFAVAISDTSNYLYKDDGTIRIRFTLKNGKTEEYLLS